MQSTLVSLGMKQCMRDNCLFYFHKNGQLSGLLVFHVDDFLTSGNSEFQKDIISKLRKKYAFGDISHTDFTFTGLHIFQNHDHEIYVDQEDFASKMEIFEYTRQDNDNILKKEENSQIRRTTGQLNWLSMQTRPDLSFDALSLSMNLNFAKYKDAKVSRKVVMKAKEEKVAVKYSHIGKLEDFTVEVFADASLGNIESKNETKSVMGMFIAL